MLRPGSVDPGHRHPVRSTHRLGGDRVRQKNADRSCRTRRRRNLPAGGSAVMRSPASLWSSAWRLRRPFCPRIEYLTRSVLRHAGQVRPGSGRAICSTAAGNALTVASAALPISFHPVRSGTFRGRASTVLCVHRIVSDRARQARRRLHRRPEESIAELFAGKGCRCHAMGRMKPGRSLGRRHRWVGRAWDPARRHGTDRDPQLDEPAAPP